jgi:hypothetical protein
VLGQAPPDTRSHVGFQIIEGNKNAAHSCEETFIEHNRFGRHAPSLSCGTDVSLQDAIRAGAHFKRDLAEEGHYSSHYLATDGVVKLSQYGSG